MIRVSTFLVAVSVTAAGCSGLPTGPDGNESLLSATHGAAVSAVAASLEPTPSTRDAAGTADGRSGTARGHDAACCRLQPVSASRRRHHRPRRPVRHRLHRLPFRHRRPCLAARRSVCAATPCGPPTTLTCPPGLVPTLGETLTCQPPIPTLTCPAGKHPVLGDTAHLCERLVSVAILELCGCDTPQSSSHPTAVPAKCPQQNGQARDLAASASNELVGMAGFEPATP